MAGSLPPTKPKFSPRYRRTSRWTRFGHRACSCATQRCEPQSLEQQIHRRFGILSDETQGRHERHSTLWAAIEWSWNLIDHELRAALAALFREIFELRAASAL